MADKPTTTETWTSLGKDVWNNRTGELADRWLDENGTELHYAKVPGGVVGGRYTVKVSRDDGHTKIVGRPDYLDRIDDLEQVAVWQAADHEARDLQRHRREERRLARSTDALDAQIGGLLGAAERCKNWAELEALRSAVSMRLLDAWETGLKRKGSR